MANSVYQINKGINKSIEFKGLKAQYIWYLGAGILALLIISTDKTKFSMGFASTLGQLLPCNHIYNQYVFIEDAQKTIQKLESKRLRLQSLSAYSRENSISRDATNDFLNEAIGDQRQPIKAHYNLLVWTDNKEQLFLCSCFWQVTCTGK